VQTATINANDVDFLNQIFDFNLKNISSNSSSSWQKQPSIEVTGFAGGPNTLPYVNATDSVDASDIRNGFYTSYYGSPENSVFGEISYGSGKIFFVSNDYYDAGFATDWGKGIHINGAYRNQSYASFVLPNLLLEASKASIDNPAVIEGDVELVTSNARSVRGELRADDPEGLSAESPFTVSGEPENGQVLLLSQGDQKVQFEYTPDESFIGEDQFLLSVTDDLGGRTNQLVEVSVTEGCAPIEYEGQELTAGGERVVLDLSECPDEKSDNPRLKVTVAMTDAPDGTSFKFETTEGLTPDYGYSFDDELRSIAFSGPEDKVNNALSEVVVTSGDCNGDADITVTTVSEAVVGDAYFRADGKEGNFYMYESQKDIPWNKARSDAKSRELFGVSGHLVNITSEEENQFIGENVEAPFAWIGLSDMDGEGIWRWMDGPEAGQVAWEADVADGDPIPLNTSGINKVGRFSSEGDKPDVTATPIPRFDLLQLDAYDSMSVQFSRGCPFNCEFCDIIVLYGRKPRTKTPEQLVAELQALYDLGWRRSIFLVDDNFIGNKRNAKLLLPQIRSWQEERGYPFSFSTEASVDLADDEEMMEMMHDARFESVFLGIETPDEASLATARKVQNTRNPLDAAVDRITANGIRVMAGFIIGFDGEKDGAGRRIVEFVTRTGIPAAMMGMLQALPKTALWARLEQEGRLIQGEDSAKGVNQTNLLNFQPTRPIRDIANEYVEAFCALYEPNAYMDRVYSYYLKMGAPRWKAAAKLPSLVDLKALTIVVWRQGVKRNTRTRFWRYLFGMARHNPTLVEQFLSVLAHNEHFLEYRSIVQREIREQLESLPPEEPTAQKELQAA
jgi:radical SAM superfamily enzyme YgiQ (UPF0313 family)